MVKNPWQRGVLFVRDLKYHVPLSDLKRVMKRMSSISRCFVQAAVCSEMPKK